MTQTIQFTDTQAEDWADQLALEIALDMQRMRNRDARELTAARLRLVRCEGEAAGINQAAAAVASVVVRS
jgi:hypothetical protein